MESTSAPPELVSWEVSLEVYPPQQRTVDAGGRIVFGFAVRVRVRSEYVSVSKFLVDVVSRGRRSHIFAPAFQNSKNWIGLALAL